MEGDWLERNKHRAYPFIDSATLTVQPLRVSGDNDPRGFYLDAYLVYRDDTASNKHDNHWQFYGVNPASSWRGYFYNSIDETSEILVPTHNTVIDNYRVLTYIDTTLGLAFTLVVNNTHALASSIDPILFSLPYPELVSRCLERYSERVESVNIAAGTWAGSNSVGELTEGTNIKLEVNPAIPLVATRDLQKSKLRPDVQRIVISATPGAGTGKVPADCSQPVDDIFTINNISGNNGEFTIEADDCYRVERRLVADVSQPNAIQVDNNCQPCCDCDDFVDVLEGIRRLKNEGLQIKKVWNQARAAYIEFKSEWEQRVQCVGDDCLSRLFGYSFTGWLLTVQVWVGNVKDCLQPGVLVALAFDSRLSVEYIPGSGMIYNSEDNYFQADPNYDAVTNKFIFLDNSAIRGGHYKLMTMSVRVLSTSERVDGMSVDIAAEVTACGAEKVNLSTQVNLIGNTNKA